MHDVIEKENVEIENLVYTIRGQQKQSELAKLLEEIPKNFLIDFHGF